MSERKLDGGNFDLEAYISELTWSAEATDHEKTLVIGNLRALYSLMEGQRMRAFGMGVIKGRESIPDAPEQRYPLGMGPWEPDDAPEALPSEVEELARRLSKAGFGCDGINGISWEAVARLVLADRAALEGKHAEERRNLMEGTRKTLEAHERAIAQARALAEADRAAAEEAVKLAGMAVDAAKMECNGSLAIQQAAYHSDLEKRLVQARRETAEECAKMIEAATRGQTVRPRPSTQWGDLMAAEIRSRFGSEGEKK